MISSFKNKVYNIVLIIFTFYFLFAPIIDNISPIKILGFSFFITFIPTVVVYSLFIVLLPNLSKKDVQLFFLLLAFFLVLYLFHSIIGINEKSFLDYVVYHRYVLFIFIVCTIFKYLHFEKYYQSYMVVFLTSLLFGSITSILYLLGLPTYRILKEDISIYEMDRFGGIWGAPNGFSNLMIILLLALLFCTDYSKMIKASIYLVTFLGCIAAGSRSPIIFIVFLLPFIFFEFKNTSKNLLKYIYFILLSFFFVFVFLYAFDLFDTLLGLKGATSRLLDNDATQDLRKDKGVFFFNYLFSSLQNIFLGINPKEQLLDVQFSDNGILLFLLDNGVPFFILYLFIMIKLFKDKSPYFKYSITIVIFGFIFIMTAGMNSVVLWDNYIYISALVFFLIKNKQKMEYLKAYS